jgi:deoxycytidylate deaminase
MRDWHKCLMENLLRQAYEYATRSPDPSNQNGALIVDPNAKVQTWGFNNIFKGVKFTKELMANRDWKLAHIEHAERDAIYRHGSCAGYFMVCPWFACEPCARAIVLSGIKGVLGHKPRMEQTPERWKASVFGGLNILERGGVDILLYEDIVPDAPYIIVNGDYWSPTVAP